MKLRKIQAFAGAVLLLGGLSIGSPVAAAGGPGGNCNGHWCWDSCVDLIEFCHGEEVGCPAQGATCKVDECQGEDYQWYDYTIECGELT